MSVREGAAAVIGGMALVVGLGAPAYAAEVVRLRETAAAELLPVAQVVADPAQNGSPMSLAPSPRRSLQLDSNGRWGLRLDMAQPASRDQDFRDVQAGAYLRLGPRLRVGGTVGLNSGAPGPQNFRPQDTAPKVRLETNFKF